MIVQKCYCDRCNKEVKNNLHDLTVVRVMVKSHETQECCQFPNEELEICNDCLDEIGFNKKQNSIPKPFELIKKLFKR